MMENIDANRFGVKTGRLLKSGDLLISCDKQENLNAIIHQLQDKIHPPKHTKQNDPQVIIHGIPNKCTIEDITEAIKCEIGDNLTTNEPKYIKIKNYKTGNNEAGQFVQVC